MGGCHKLFRGSGYPIGHRNPVLSDKLPRFDLVPHDSHGFCIRTDEDDAGIAARLHKSGIFSQKTITRVDGIATCLHGEIDNLSDI